MRKKFIATPARAGADRIHRAEDDTDWVEGQVFELDDAIVDVGSLIAMGAIEPYVEPELDPPVDLKRSSRGDPPAASKEV